MVEERRSLRGGSDSRANNPYYWDPDNEYPGPESELGTPKENWNRNAKKKSGCLVALLAGISILGTIGVTYYTSALTLNYFFN